MVDTCVPWACYAPDQAAQPDFAQPDLGAFLVACHERALQVVLRVGPQLDADLPDLGLPSWIVRDPRCQAVGPRGNPVICPGLPRAAALPSMASETYMEQAQRWLEQLGTYLAGFVRPDGPLMAVHLGSQLGMAGHLGVYGHDYRREAVAAYRRFLPEHHPQGLPACYSAGIDALEPPRSFDALVVADIPRHLDWIAFKQHHALSALDRLASALRARGLDRVPLFHALGTGDLGASCPISTLERAYELAGIDLLAPRCDPELAARTARLLLGSSRLPYVPRFPWANRSWLWLPQTPEQQAEALLAALMHGVRAFGLTPVVDRNYWYDAMLDSAARRRKPRFERARQLLSSLHDLSWHELELKPSVGLVEQNAYRALARCASLIEPFPLHLLDLLDSGGAELTDERTFGFSEAIQAAAPHFLGAVARVVRARGLAYGHLDSGVPLEALLRFPLLIVPSFDFIERDLLARLRDYVAAGGRLVLGPRRPTLDETMQPLEGELPVHELIERPEALEQLLSQAAPLSGPRSESRDVQVAHHQPGPRTSASDHVIFVANTCDEARPAALELPGGRLWDALSGVPVDNTSLVLRGRQILMLRWRP